VLLRAKGSAVSSSLPCAGPLRLPPGQHLRVDVHGVHDGVVLAVGVRPLCERGIAVAEQFRDHRDRHTVQMHERASGVTGIVQAHARQPGGVEGSVPDVVKAGRIVRLTELAVHHVIAAVPERADRQLLLARARPCALEDR
jgi:hypothetical protein